MQKKLLAVAVAGALLAPAAAMAQSSVTISGIFKVSIDNIHIKDAVGARERSSETRLTDNSSRIIFGITEDLGGGLAGIAQLDVRPQLDDAGEGNVAAGNTWVGIRSTSLGTLTFGRHDVHYGKQPDDTAANAGMLQASAVSLMDYIGAGPAVGAVANATRTPNVVRYDTPNWSGFAATVAYSTNAAGNEADLNADMRRGNAWNFNPSYTSGPFQVGYSYWRSEPDASATELEQTSHVVYGYYRFGPFKVGLAFNQAEQETTAGKINDRLVWTLPVSWSSGPHHIAGHFTRADDDDEAGDDTGASMFAIAYSYLLSKRTSVGVTFANLKNDDNAQYNFFTNSATSLGSANSPLGLGEDGRLIGFTMRHAF